MPKVFSNDDIPVTPNAIPIKNDLSKLSHLLRLHFPRIHGGTVTLLIVADGSEIFCMQSIRKDTRGQPIAIETPLGWLLLGSFTFAFNFKKLFCQLHKNQIQFLNLKSARSGKLSSATILQYLAFLHQETIASSMILCLNKLIILQVNYHIPLLWISDVELPQESIVMAQRRLFSLKKRLSSDTVLFNKCVKY